MLQIGYTWYHYSTTHLESFNVQHTGSVSRGYQEVPTNFDNKGVLNYGTKAEKDLKEEQTQGDVLYVTKGLSSDNLVKTVVN